MQSHTLEPIVYKWYMYIFHQEVYTCELGLRQLSPSSAEAEMEWGPPDTGVP